MAARDSTPEETILVYIHSLPSEGYRAEWLARFTPEEFTSAVGLEPALCRRVLHELTSGGRIRIIVHPDGRFSPVIPEAPADID